MVDTLERQISQRIQETDWNALGRKLTGYAAKRARRLGLSASRDQALVGDINPVDIAQEAITRFFEGRRTWDPEKRELDQFLYDTVDSLLSNHMDLHDTQLRGDLPRTGDGEELLDGAEHHARMHDLHGILSTPPPTPDATTTKTDFADARLGALLYETAADPELVEVIEAIIDGAHPKPQDIADKLGITVNDVNNRIKRLRLAAKRILTAESAATRANDPGA